MKDNFSEEIKRLAIKQYEKVKETNNKGKWKPTPESIDAHQAPEWFKDAKFGMFVDWGLWSVAGWAPKKEVEAMYPDWYELRLDTDSAFIPYHEKNWGKDFKRDDFIPLFTAKNYQPAKLVDIAKDAGMKYVVPFCKHHSGFCLWPSSYTFRDASDMGPKKDLVAPLVENCKKKGLKFGFYFSIEEWEYPVIDGQGNLQQRKWNGTINPFSADLGNKCSGKIAVHDFALDYLVPQATEFIDQYDPDLLWFDGDWNTDVNELHTYDIAAYFYNKAEGRKPVAVNDRYGANKGERYQRWKRGDFFTNEYGDMDKETKKSIHAWEECRGISQSFGYNWQDTDENVISSKKFIDMFVDIVAHGGNLLLIVNLDEQGALPKIQENRLQDIGKWLKVNGKGIYATRPYKQQTEGSVSYTQSKDGQYVYAIIKEWPGSQLQLKNVIPVKDSKIELLGYNNSLRWTHSTDGVTVKFPIQLENEGKRPCKHAWVLKIKQVPES
ncbi:MAG: alpha-L-fucosidase [Mangrovibacterium sp.]